MNPREKALQKMEEEGLIADPDAKLDEATIAIEFPEPHPLKRSLLVSYLDDELLVVRDAFGRPDVLMRVDSPAAPTPSGAAEADGADAADDEAPGAS